MKVALSLALFYAINYGLRDYLVYSLGKNPEWTSFLVYLILFVLIGTMYAREIKSSLVGVKKDLNSASRLLKWIILPMFISYVLVIFLTYGLAFLGIDIVPANNENIKGIEKSLPQVLTFLMMTIFAPVIEESVFRENFLNSKVSQKNGGRVFLFILSNLLFAAIHIDPSSLGNFKSLLYYLPISLGLSFVYIKNGRRLAASILAHALVNLLAFIFIALGVVL